MRNALCATVLVLTSIASLFGQENLSDSLILYYRFSGDVTDYSPNQIGATVYGAELTSNRFDEENSAYYFDGKDDYILCDTTDTILNQNFETLTIAAWIFPEEGAETTYGSRIINTRGTGLAGTGYPGYQLKTEYDANSKKWGLFDCMIEDVESDYSRCVWCGDVYDIDSWHHVVMEFKSGYLSFYVDGILDTELFITS
jgi:hypothetical protein